MSTMKITIEDMGITKTYKKDFGEDYPISVSDYFETCLNAYEAQTYCNEIDVNIYGLSGNVTQTVHWDRDNGLSIDEEMDIVEDIMGFFSDRKESWYMGNNY